MRLVLTVTMVLGAACSPDDVSLRGRIYDDMTSKSAPLAAAQLEIRNGLGGPVDTTESNGSGRFSLNVPGGQRIYAIVSHEDGYVPAGFTGSSGSDPVLRIPSNTLFAVPESSLAIRLARFDGCPGLTEGGVALGEVRVNNLTDEQTGENPLVQTAIVEWVQATGEQQVVPACYLDEEGGGYDSEAAVTGSSGLYAIPNVPSGVGVLSVRYAILEGAEATEVSYDVYMPEDGVVARFPTWVEFETPIQ